MQVEYYAFKDASLHQWLNCMLLRPPVSGVFFFRCNSTIISTKITLISIWPASFTLENSILEPMLLQDETSEWYRSLWFHDELFTLPMSHSLNEIYWTHSFAVWRALNIFGCSERFCCVWIKKTTHSTIIILSIKMNWTHHIIPL